MRRPVLGIFATASVALLSVAPVVLVASSAEAATSTSCVQAAINDVSHPEGNASTTDFDFTVTVTFPPGCNNTAGEAVDYATADGTATAPTDYSSTSGTFSFTVRLSDPSTQTVTGDYATADGSAMAPEDYASTSGTLTFLPSVTSQMVNVSVNGDTAGEPDENFYVNLSNPQHATIADGQGLGTIVNDDGSAPSISISDVTRFEGNSGTTNFDFLVDLSAPSTGPVSVHYA